ncbi:hypothetical protein EDB85DRAFT_1887952 [Lactarius pseudohatsudake]|nr:hypothetical protein EDB85DRAFT_1887952 [Lactarius pseudohatsudake]
MGFADVFSLFAHGFCRKYRQYLAPLCDIAKLGLAGDVPLLPECGRTDSPAVQRTISQQFAKGYDWCPGQPRVDPYVHYRLVLETLGEPLHTFKSTRELCEVLRNAITAHTGAYERVGILHRDVSAGNILITEGRSGILIDWDLSKKVVKDRSEKQRQYSRTGTWQFISICRSVRKIDLSQDMQSVFDQSEDMDDDGTIRGGRGKLHCLQQGVLGRMAVDYLVDTPCKVIIEDLRSLFNNLYRHIEPPFDTIPSMRLDIDSVREQDERVQDAVRKLRSSEEVLSIINKHLDSTGSWDVDNDGSLCKAKFRPDRATSRNRRKRKAEDDGGKDFNERRRGRFPPSSTQPSQSRDILGLQRHRSSFGSGSSRTRPSENQKESIFHARTSPSRIFLSTSTSSPHSMPSPQFAISPDNIKLSKGALCIFTSRPLCHRWMWGGVVVVVSEASRVVDEDAATGGGGLRFFYGYRDVGKYTQKQEVVREVVVHPAKFAIVADTYDNVEARILYTWEKVIGLAFVEDGTVEGPDGTVTTERSWTGEKQMQETNVLLHAQAGKRPVRPKMNTLHLSAIKASQR